MKTMSHFKYAIIFIATFLLISIVITKSTKTVANLASWEDLSAQSNDISQAKMIGNPAAVYCTDMGYKFQIISDGAGGQTDTCSMPNNVVCDGWDFLEGKCGQNYSYCAKHGLSIRTATDGKNPFSREYAVCVDANGKDIGSVTTLDKLDLKLNHCGAEDDFHGTTPEEDEATNQPTASYLKPLTDAVVAPPTAWDWRNATYNSITGDWTSPVKDQASCGSCWAFAAVGQTESALNIAFNNPNLDKNLSEEYLVSDCTTAGTCCGGSSPASLDFIQNKGIPDEACMPYASSSCGGCDTNGVCNCTYSGSNICANSTCSQRCSDYENRLSYLDSNGSVSSDPTAVKQALINYGPLTVYIYMGGDFEGDVFKCSISNPINHAVNLVGYNDAGGYWIAKNSWGSSWNGDGFFKVGYGQCLIENYVYYAQASSAAQWKISGYVRTNKGTGISGVTMNGLPHNPITDTNGYYSDHVSNGWSGIVIPSLAGYVFNPTNLGYSNVTSNRTNQNYTGDNPPDLKPYAPAGYPYPVIPSSIQGTNEINMLYAGADTYFDWHFINNGGAFIGSFFVELWVDNTRYIRYPYSGYGAGSIGGFDDWDIPNLTPGVHTLKIITDPDNTITEADETNNVWSAQFTWQPITGWKGEYFNNKTLSGGPWLTRDDFSLDFPDWGMGAPDPSLPAESFSARWTRMLNFPAGSYRFHMGHDDGGRLYVDDILRLDRWTTCCTWDTVEVSLSGGNHIVRMEMFENGGASNVGLWWERLNITGWRGEYYNNLTLNGHPILIRDDGDSLNFEWEGESPDPLVLGEFSARWTRRLYFNGGEYRFGLFHDDGARFYIDNLLIGNWWCTGCRQYDNVTITLSGGAHDLKLEMVDDGGWASAQLYWQFFGNYNEYLPLLLLK